MSRDTQTKNNNKMVVTRKKKTHEESSDDGSSLYSDNSEEEMDKHEYRKFLKKLFPSKHLDKKIKAGDRLKKKIKEVIKNTHIESDNECEEETTKSKERKYIKQKKETYKKPKTNTNKKAKKNISEDEDYDEDDDEDYDNENSECESEDLGSVDTDEDEDEEDEDEDNANYKKNKKTEKQSSNFNITFTIGEKRREDEYEYEEDEYDDEWETETGSSTENEDDPVSSDTDEDIKETNCKNKNNNNEQKNKKTNKQEEIIQNIKNNNENNVENMNIDENANVNENVNENEILLQLKELVSKNPNNKYIEKCLETYETNIKNDKFKAEKKLKKEKARNCRIFKKILRDKNTMNDFEFYDKLELDKQKKIIKELREINKISRIEKPYRLTLLESNIPVIFKAAAIKKINSLRNMEPGSGEFYKIKNWVDTFMRIPFSEYKTLPISIDEGVEECHQFMEHAQKTLDDAVYGLNDAKMQIMQMLGQLITNPNAVGSAIAIHGPAGTGKTTLVKEGISKILDRPFAFIALGGATDSSFLEGHGYTYEGSTWGKIVQILIDSKCMNPVIYFDELDKISDTPKGEEITGILTHLTDTSQNMQFHDKYFTEIDFDLSKCLFIFSYNDETKVNPILKDRMYRIQTKGYSQKQKNVISNNYLLPKIREQVKFKNEDIIIPDQTLTHIIENYCNKEDGVRNLKRCLEIIHTKLNLYRLMRPDTNLFEEDMSLKVTFPFNITKDVVDKLIKKSENSLNPSLYHLYT
jgi:ATP-dependent Lon protease